MSTKCAKAGTSSSEGGESAKSLKGPSAIPLNAKAENASSGEAAKAEKKASSNGGSGKASKLGKGGEMWMALSSVKSEKAEGAEGGGGELPITVRYWRYPNMHVDRNVDN